MRERPWQARCHTAGKLTWLMPSFPTSLARDTEANDTSGCEGEHAPAQRWRSFGDQAVRLLSPESREDSARFYVFFFLSTTNYNLLIIALTAASRLRT